MNIRDPQLSTFVGREAELEALLSIWDESREGQIRVVNLTGEAGLGKSRLVHEVIGRLESADPVLLQGDCFSTGTGTPFLPFIGIVRRSFGIAEGASLDQAADKLGQGLEQLGLNAEDEAPFLLNILGLVNPQQLSERLGPLSAPEIVGERTKRLLKGILEERAKRSPVVLIVEDLHWIDSASEELLGAIAEDDQPVPLLIICTSRPTYDVPWSEASGVRNIRLEPLASEVTLTLLKDRLGLDSLEDDLARLVVDKAEGNPLFAEELASYLREQRSSDGGAAAGPDGGSISLPTSLENLLMERVDRLAGEPRKVLRTAAVVGRRFSSQLVKEAASLKERFQTDINTLEEHQLVFPDDRDGWADYLFKHALVQDAVYGSILQSDRASMHRRVAEALEHHFSNQLEEVVEVLADHFERAGDADKTIHYKRLAGDKALGLFSIKEADAFYRDAVRIIEERDSPEDNPVLGQILASWMQIHCWRSNFGEMRRTCERYLGRVESLGEGRELSRLLQWLGEAYLSTARFEESRKVLDRALEIGTRLKDEDCMIFAATDLIYLAYLSPEQFPSDYIETTAPKVLVDAEAANDRYHQWFTLVLFFSDCLQRGLMAKAGELNQRMIELGRSTGYPPAVTFGCFGKSFLSAYSGNIEQALREADEARRVAVGETEEIVAEIGKAVVLVMAERGAESLDSLAQFSALARETENQYLLNWVENVLGLAQMAAGDLGKGVATLNASIEMFKEWGNTPRVAEAHWMLGLVYLSLATKAEKPTLKLILKNLGFLLRHAPSAARRAKEHLETAVELGAMAQMDGLVAQAHLSLGVLARAQKQPDEASRHLATARETAAPLGWSHLSAEIDAALADA